MRRAVLLSALAATVVLASGCGSGGGERLSKDEYQRQAAAVGERLGTEFSDIESTDETDLSAIAPLMYRLADALDTLANEFDDLSPPQEVEGAHDRFVAAARATADDARAVGDRVEHDSLVELQNHLSELDISKGESFRELQQAMADIRSAGYDFGGNFGG